MLHITEAQFNAVHLVRAMAKLLPDWLPRPLYQALLQRWQAPQRRGRCARSMGTACAAWRWAVVYVHVHVHTLRLRICMDAECLPPWGIPWRYQMHARQG